jgi:hypothetical protein
METKIARQTAGWTIEGWAQFWTAPTVEIARERVPFVCSPSVVGYWPRQPEPVRGVADYCQHIVDLLTMIPDAHLKLEEHATTGEFVFARWSGFGTGPDGAFEMTGVDRIRLRDGKVIENRIMSDGSIFEHFAKYIGERRLRAGDRLTPAAVGR